MSLSYAGVPLTVLAPEQVQEINTLLDLTWIEEFTARNWPGLDLTTLGFRGSLPVQPVKVGSLYWPAGASRFAVGHFIASEAQLAAIRAALAGSAGIASLVINDGQNTISPALTMLPVRPLYRVNTSGALANVSYPLPAPSGVSPSPSGLYLLTLVDDRFAWWFRSGSLTMTPGTTTWAQLYASIASLLGVSITVDSIPAAYELPAGDFATQFLSLPTLLDAVAFSVGQRIVRRLDGTVHALNASSGQTALASNLGLAVRLAGDAFDLAGGSGSDLSRALPSSVRVTFPVLDSASLEPQLLPYTSNQTLASLALPEIGAAAGFAGQKTLHCTATGLATAGVTGNTAELDAIARQAAIDFYRWNASGVDALYSGAVAWVMDGFADLVEFQHTQQWVCTRVQRGPWLDHIDRLLVYGVHGAQSGPTYINQTINNINTEVNYDSTSVVNYFNTTVNVFGNWYIPINQFWIINGPGILVLNLFVQFTGGVEICGEMFWCYATVPTFNDFQVDNLDLRAIPTPPTKKIVYRISSSIPDVLDSDDNVIPGAGGTRLTGIKHYGDGQVYELIVVGENPIILQNQVGSAADNQFFLPGGAQEADASVTLYPGESVLLWWDGFDQKWKIAADTGVTGDSPGDPGALAQWVQPDVITNFRAGGDGEVPIGAADGSWQSNTLTPLPGIKIVNGPHDIGIGTDGPDMVIPIPVAIDCSGSSPVFVFVRLNVIGGSIRGYI